MPISLERALQIAERALQDWSERASEADAIEIDEALPTIEREIDLLTRCTGCGKAINALYCEKCHISA